MTPDWPVPLRFGAWLLHERLGLGGTSEVWRATGGGQPGEVALKRLLPPFRDDRLLLQQFANEVEVMRRVVSPRLPRLLAAGTDNGLPWLATPLLAGAPSGDVAPPVPWQDALRWLADVLDALADLHAAGYVHGDVSPGNVWQTPDGEVRLLDLGLAMPLGSVPAQVQGTRGFRSPEQERLLPLTAQADLWAVGRLLQHWLADAPRPAAVQDLLVRLTAALPSERPRDAATVAAQARALLKSP